MHCSSGDDVRCRSTDYGFGASPEENTDADLLPADQDAAPNQDEHADKGAIIDRYIHTHEHGHTFGHEHPHSSAERDANRHGHEHGHSVEYPDCHTAEQLNADDPGRALAHFLGYTHEYRATIHGDNSEGRDGDASDDVGAASKRDATDSTA